MRATSPAATIAILAWLAIAATTTNVVTAESDSVGTLVSCSLERDVPCLWTGNDGQVIDSQALRRLLLAQNDVDDRDAATPLRNLQRHMDYIGSACSFLSYF